MKERKSYPLKNKMEKVKKEYSSQNWLNIVRVGWFLAVKQIINSSKATTALIVFIMMLTFLNLVVVSGVLVGLIEGANKANKEQYTGDLLISTPAGKSEIENTYEIENTLRKMANIKNISVRYM